jgi:mono/diheme cytochrome c family protein
MRLHFVLGIMVAAAGCGDDKAAGSVDAAPVVIDAPVAAPDASKADQVARGDYLVNHVDACGDCHTPRNPDGSPDTTRLFAGVDCLVDVAPMDDNVGCLSSRNLTNDPTGLANRTDKEVMDMFQKGMRPGGEFLNPFMPYYVFANMTDDDAKSVVAYLRTLPAVSHTVMAQQPPWNNVTAPAPALDPATIPKDPNETKSTKNGRYLAALGGICIECHTPSAAMGASRPIDVTRFFAGGRDFGGVVPSPPFPAHIYSANLTQDATGLAGWTPAEIVKVLHQGIDDQGDGICPPMPVGPMGAFGGLTDSDAQDIANYILTIPPIVNSNPNDCVVPGTRVID